MHQFWNFVAQIEAGLLPAEEIPDQVQDHLQVEEISDQVRRIAWRRTGGPSMFARFTFYQ